MKKQNSFSAGDQATLIPAAFFNDLLFSIDHLGELKITLYAFWFMQKLEGEIQFIEKKNFLDDPKLMSGLAKTAKQAAVVLEDSLTRAIERGTFLKADLQTKGECVYLLNDARGRAAQQAILKGKWDPRSTPQPEIALSLERPDIFYLYEKNIGPLTPMIAEDLKEAEKLYPGDWLQDAIHIAVKKNVRRWNYVEAILKSWKENGRNEEDRRNRTEDRGKYIQGEYGDLIKH